MNILGTAPIMAGVLVLLASGCGLQQDPQPVLRNAVTVADGILASYEVLSAQGEPGTSFPEGENIRLSFSVQNNTDSLVILPTWLFPMTNPGFFRLYREEATEGGRQDVGRAINNACCRLDGGPQPVLPHTTIRYIMPWQTKDGEQFELPITYPQQKPSGRLYSKRGQPNLPLAKGTYHSAFTLDIQGKPTSFSLTFTIQ